MCPVHRMKAAEYQFAGLYRGHAMLLQINGPHRIIKRFQLLSLYYFAMMKKKEKKMNFIYENVCV